MEGLIYLFTTYFTNLSLLKILYCSVTEISVNNVLNMKQEARVVA